MTAIKSHVEKESVPDTLCAPSFIEALRQWLSIGVLSFGGPAAQIALMHRVIVDERSWLSERQFLNALSLCMLLPGPEAMQLATYAGWRLHGWRGGLAAGLSFVLPGALVVLLLAMLYMSVGNIPLVAALFVGIKATVIVIVIEALLRISRRTLDDRAQWLIAAVSFIGIFFLNLPFPLIILMAALFGFFFQVADREPAEAPGRHSLHLSYGRTWRTVATWLVIWLLPLSLLSAVFGSDHLLSQLGWFFSKLAVVTFGGAYAVLAYMGQDVVVRYEWLEATQMVDALGLAETTPGPLILVTEFVGYVAAFTHAGTPAWLMGLSGAIIALWATFAPCFLWIFTLAPYVDLVNEQPRIKAALRAITSAVVGVILNLALWFALHVYFTQVQALAIGPLNLWWPEPSSIAWAPVMSTICSGYLLLVRHRSIPIVLLVSALLGVAMQLVAGAVAP